MSILQTHTLARLVERRALLEHNLAAFTQNRKMAREEFHEWLDTARTRALDELRYNVAQLIAAVAHLDSVEREVL